MIAAGIHGTKWPLEGFFATPLQSQEGALGKQIQEVTKHRLASPNIPADLAYPCPSPSGEGLPVPHFWASNPNSGVHTWVSMPGVCVPVSGLVNGHMLHPQSGERSVLPPPPRNS